MNKFNTPRGNRDDLPPHENDAERAVLGITLMLSKIPAEAEALSSVDFYGRRHAQIWAAMQQLQTAGFAIDMVSVRVLVSQAEPKETPERLAAEIAALLDGGWVPANMAFHVGVVRKYSALRKCIASSSDLIDLARSAPDDFQDLIAAAERQIANLTEHSAVVDAWGFPFKSWDLSTVGFAEAQEVAWTIEPVMAAPDVVCLVGDGGVGKSKIAAAVSLSVAFEKPVLGQFAVKRTGRVVYLNEERPDLTRRHLHTLAPPLGIDPATIQDRISLFGRGRRPWWVTEVAARSGLIRRLKQLGDVALVVFDSLHVLHGAEENDNAEMTQVIEAFRRICLDVGCCGLIIHHTGKGPGGEATASARGASAIKDSVDSQFLVRRLKNDDPAQLRIQQDKTRRALIQPFLIRMEHDSSGDVLALTNVGKAPSKAETALPDVIAAIEEADEPLKSGEIALKLAKKHRKDDVYAALTLVREQNLLPWRAGPRNGFLYGGEPDGPGE